jgi:hypothetical protein
MLVYNPVGATANTNCNSKYIHCNLLPTGAQGLFAHSVFGEEYKLLMKFLTVQFSSSCLYFLSLRSIYSTQHCVWEHP